MGPVFGGVPMGSVIVWFIVVALFSVVMIYYLFKDEDKK